MSRSRLVVSLLIADMVAGDQTLGKTERKALYTQFTKTAITFEPLELQWRDTTHFKALDELFLTVSNTKGFKLQKEFESFWKLLLQTTKSEGVKEKKILLHGTIREKS